MAGILNQVFNLCCVDFLFFFLRNERVTTEILSLKVWRPSYLSTRAFWSCLHSYIRIWAFWNCLVRQAKWVFRLPYILHETHYPCNAVFGRDTSGPPKDSVIWRDQKINQTKTNKQIKRPSDESNLRPRFTGSLWSSG